MVLPFLRKQGDTPNVSLVDSFTLATANCLSGTLVTSDHHELEQVEQQELIPFLWIR
jgi:hypothetical protein